MLCDLAMHRPCHHVARTLSNSSRSTCPSLRARSSSSESCSMADLAFVSSASRSSSSALTSSSSPSFCRSAAASSLSRGVAMAGHNLVTALPDGGAHGRRAAVEHAGVAT